jgi:hypothetical protein
MHPAAWRNKATAEQPMVRSGPILVSTIRHLETIGRPGRDLAPRSGASCHGQPSFGLYHSDFLLYSRYVMKLSHTRNPFRREVGERKIGQYRAARAHPTVRDAFACACQWHRLVGGLRVDGGPCPGALAQLVVQVCRDGMQKHARAGNPGFDCFDARGRRVQIKGIGSVTRNAVDVDPTKADRLIVVRIYPTSWDVWYDGPIDGLPHGPSPEARDRKGNKISIKLPELRRVAKPDTWTRFWHSGGAAPVRMK